MHGRGTGGAFAARLAAAGSLAAAAIVSAGPVATAQEGTLIVTPSSGPVGTEVTIEGRGCSNPGQDTAYLSFEGGPQYGSTEGADSEGLGTTPVDEQGRFSVRYTIPAEIGTIQGSVGGPVGPGRYVIRSHPPICSADFRVTAGPDGGELPRTGASLLAIVVTAGLTSVGGLILLFVNRRSASIAG